MSLSIGDEVILGRMMDRKLPIAEAAMDSIVFGLKTVPTAVRLGWVGFLIYATLLLVGGLAFFQAAPELMAYLGDILYVAGGIDTSQPGWEEQVRRSIEDVELPLSTSISVGLSVLFFILAGTALLPVMVLILRLAAQDTNGPRSWWYYQWTGREWRTLATSIMASLIWLFAAGLVSVLIEMVASSIAASDDTRIHWALVVAEVIGLIVMIWVFVRTSLMIPAAAIENELNLFSAIGATGGNVFRLIGSAVLLGFAIMMMWIAFSLLGLIIIFISTLVGSGVGYATTDGTMLLNVFSGNVVMAVGGILTLIGFVYATIASNLACTAWLGIAWASLRPDGVARCRSDAIGDGEVCEI